MQIKELGHIVLYVTDIQKMTYFYEKILGFKKLESNSHLSVAMFSGGRTHHELLLIEIGERSKPKGTFPGLYHIGFKIGDSDSDLKEALEICQKNQVKIIGLTDHTVTHSLYIMDPDGNELELYVDVRDDWKDNPELIMTPPKTLEI
jgi:catechol 2,3-dioxygenase